MQIEVHTEAQETSNGSSAAYIEPDMNVSRLVLVVSQISVNLLGNITIKAQCSPDGETWFDIPNLATAGLTATGGVTVNLSAPFRAGDYMRVTWTFSNANSITFSAFLVGD